MPLLSLDDIKNKAPDRTAFAAAKKIATAASWSSLGRQPNILWGVALGSKGDSYSVYIDASRSAFECNCASRKRPCKHALALLILDASGQEIPDKEPASNHKWQAEERYYRSWE
jgi:hypothetical protein